MKGENFDSWREGSHRRAVLAGAAQIGVSVEPQSWQADYKAKGLSGRFVDEVDYHLTAPWRRLGRPEAAVGKSRRLAN